MVPLSLFVFEELAGHNDADAVAIWVSLAREIEVEVDRTHDAVAKFFVDQFLQGRAVIPARSRRKQQSDLSGSARARN